MLYLPRGRAPCALLPLPLLLPPLLMPPLLPLLLRHRRPDNHPPVPSLLPLAWCELTSHWHPRPPVTSVDFDKEAHATYLLAGLHNLASGYVSLDASRPWLTYWITHSLLMLGPTYAVSGERAEEVASFLGLCQAPESGGFAGGPVPGQSSHLAPTYAAINTLVTLGTPSALQIIDRTSLRTFLLRMKTDAGGFQMHDDGECDVRGVYTALAVASLTNILDDELRRGAAEWVASCQTYEGGIGATPGEEAHGGYTFCGLAAMVRMHVCTYVPSAASPRWYVCMYVRMYLLRPRRDGAARQRRDAPAVHTYVRTYVQVLLDSVEMLRLSDLTAWLVQRQMSTHGGFQGPCTCMHACMYMHTDEHARRLPRSVSTELSTRHAYMQSCVHACMRTCMYAYMHTGRCNKLVDGCYSFWQGGTFPLLEAALG